MGVVMKSLSKEAYFKQQVNIYFSKVAKNSDAQIGISFQQRETVHNF